MDTSTWLVMSWSNDKLKGVQIWSSQELAQSAWEDAVNSLRIAGKSPFEYIYTHLRVLIHHYTCCAAVGQGCCCGLKYAPHSCLRGMSACSSIGPVKKEPSSAGRTGQRQAEKEQGPLDPSLLTSGLTQSAPEQPGEDASIARESVGTEHQDTTTEQTRSDAVVTKQVQQTPDEPSSEGIASADQGVLSHTMIVKDTCSEDEVMEGEQSHMLDSIIIHLLF